jgi:hypothetical protein
MTRDLGERKRAVLVALEANEYVGEQEAAQGLSTTELAERIYATEYFTTRQARLAATHRALAALMRAGLVIRVGKMDGNKRHAYWRRSSTTSRHP